MKRVRGGARRRCVGNLGGTVRTVARSARALSRCAPPLFGERDLVSVSEWSQADNRLVKQRRAALFAALTSSALISVDALRPSGVPSPDQAQRGYDGLVDASPLRHTRCSRHLRDDRAPCVDYGQRHGRISASVQMEVLSDPLKPSGLHAPFKLGPGLSRKPLPSPLSWDPLQTPVRQSMPGLYDLITCTCACIGHADPQSVRVANLRRRATGLASPTNLILVMTRLQLQVDNM